jgi:DnaJ-class molecular chaperone
VRTAFRRKMMGNHPDTSTDCTDDTMARRLIEAYRLLMDTASRSAPDPTVGRVGERTPVVRRVDVGQVPTRAQRPCSHCEGAGLRLLLVTCPACRGDSFVTSLDIRRVTVSRCSTCAGLGQVRSLVQCGECGGTGED